MCALLNELARVDAAVQKIRFAIVMSEEATEAHQAPREPTEVGARGVSDWWRRYPIKKW